MPIHQPLFNLFSRASSNLFPLLEKEGVGCIPYSPLAQGLLTDRYLKGFAPSLSSGKTAWLPKEDAWTTRKLRSQFIE